MKIFSQQIIKSTNKKQIYSLINDIPGISRAQLAAITKLSKTTVSALTDELIQERYIVDEGAAESNKMGRKPNSLAVNSRDNCFVVLNWHKRNAEIALVDAGIHIKQCRDEALDESCDYVPQLKKILTGFIEESCQGKRVLGICIIVPGIIDTEKKSIYSMVLSVEGENNSILRLREKIPDYPMAFFNDTACFAYAENVYGSMEGKSYVYLNLNEGIGATLVYEGNILKGANGMATQFGHFSIHRDGKPCICGNRGCLENEIGELALTRRAKELGVSDRFGETDYIMFRDVGRLAERQDEKALMLMDALAQDLSFGLSNLIVMFHPECIVIGGMGRKLGQLFLDKVVGYVKETGFLQFVSDVELKYTSLKEEAVLLGAAKYFTDMHLQFMEDMQDKLILS